jgi:hypothetical protein
MNECYQMRHTIAIQGYRCGNVIEFLTTMAVLICSTQCGVPAHHCSIVSLDINHESYV